MAHPDFRSRELELNSVRAGQLYTDELASRWLRWAVGGDPCARELVGHPTIRRFGGLRPCVSGSGAHAGGSSKATVRDAGGGVAAEYCSCGDCWQYLGSGACAVMRKGS